MQSPVEVRWEKWEISRRWKNTVKLVSAGVHLMTRGHGEMSKRSWSLDNYVSSPDSRSSGFPNRDNPAAFSIKKPSVCEEHSTHDYGTPPTGLMMLKLIVGLMEIRTKVRRRNFDLNSIKLVEYVESQPWGQAGQNKIKYMH